MLELRETGVVQRARDLVRHDAEVGRARPIFVADPHCRVKAWPITLLEAGTGDLARQAGLAIATQADDQYGGRALPKPVDHLGEYLLTHHELAVGWRG